MVVQHAERRTSSRNPLWPNLIYQIVGSMDVPPPTTELVGHGYYSKVTQFGCSVAEDVRFTPPAPTQPALAASHRLDVPSVPQSRSVCCLCQSAESPRLAPPPACVDVPAQRSRQRRTAIRGRSDRAQRRNRHAEQRRGVRRAVEVGAGQLRARPAGSSETGLSPASGRYTGELSRAKCDAIR